MSPVLTPEEVQVFLQDIPDQNLLLDGLEFSRSQILLSIDLAVSEFNMIQPISYATLADFPNKSVLLNGTCWKLYAGAAALAARNTMSYSDGGLQIPIEERFQYYTALSQSFQADFIRAASGLKQSVNMAAGWGSVGSDYAAFPNW